MTRCVPRYNLGTRIVDGSIRFRRLIKNRDKLFLWLVLTLLVLFGVLACCPEDPYKNYLNLIINTEPKSLDPALSTDITKPVSSRPA